MTHQGMAAEPYYILKVTESGTYMKISNQSPDNYWMCKDEDMIQVGALGWDGYNEPFSMKNAADSRDSYILYLELMDSGNHWVVIPKDPEASIQKALRILRKSWCRKSIIFIASVQELK